jgi:hypothetical protein
MKSLQHQVKQLEEQAATAAADKLTQFHFSESARRAYFVAGAISAAEKISTAISAESIRTLERFAGEKHYESLGFNSLREFLDKSEYSPMTFHQYYDRKQLLEREGEQVFDLFSGLGIPISRRKKLARGVVEIDGDEIIIHHDSGDERIPVSNRTAIMHTIATLADAVAVKSNELERQQRALRQAEETARRAYAEADHAKASSFADDHSIALAELLSSFKRLETIARSLPKTVCTSRSMKVFEAVAAAYSSLRDAYGLPPLSAIPDNLMPENEWVEHFVRIDQNS